MITTEQFIDYLLEGEMELPSNAYLMSERWSEDYYNPPILLGFIDGTPVFEGDSSPLCCLIVDALVEDVPF